MHVVRIWVLAIKTHWGFFGLSLSASVGFLVLTCFNYKRMKVHTYIIHRFSPFIILLVKSCDHCHGDSLIQLPWHLLWCRRPRRLFKVACFRWAKHAIRTFHWPLNWAKFSTIHVHSLDKADTASLKCVSFLASYSRRTRNIKLNLTNQYPYISVFLLVNPLSQHHLGSLD